MNPAQYDAWYDSPLGAACLESEIALLRQSAGELAEKEILEVGCGTGRFLLALGQAAAKAVGVDRDKTMLDFAQQSQPPHSQNRFTWVEGDASAIPLNDDSFDIVFSNTLLCFCENPVRIIQEMVRVCRQRGRIVIGELNPSSPWQCWRRLKAACGIGSFRGAFWHSPHSIVATLEAAGCLAQCICRSIFWPPLSTADLLHWRSRTERLGQRLWPWAGAYYVLVGVKTVPGCGRGGYCDWNQSGFTIRRSGRLDRR